MLDFCAAHGIVSEIETIGIQQVNEAYERLLKSDVRYRFVIDRAWGVRPIASTPMLYRAMPMLNSAPRLRTDNSQSKATRETNTEVNKFGHKSDH